MEFFLEAVSGGGRRLFLDGRGGWREGDSRGDSPLFSSASEARRALSASPAPEGFSAWVLPVWDADELKKPFMDALFFAMFVRRHAAWKSPDDDDVRVFFRDGRVDMEFCCCAEVEDDLSVARFEHIVRGALDSSALSPLWSVSSEKMGGLGRWRVLTCSLECSFSVAGLEMLHKFDFDPGSLSRFFDEVVANEHFRIPSGGSYGRA